MAARPSRAAAYVPGPSFAEMRRGAAHAPNDLYRIGWHGPIYELPRDLTGVEARILVLLGYTFPSGSHKVGATYAIIKEAEERGDIVPGRTRLIGPSTGNFGIGTAWTARQKGYQAVVVMPDGMSPERTERIRQYGADIVFTPGTESDCLLAIEKAKEMGQEKDNFVLAQFEDFANYRFHYHCTGGAVLDRVEGHIAAFVSAPGSAGTIAAADHIKVTHPDCLAVAAEPVQCPTLQDGTFGQHQIEGIGDKMAPLILNISALDRVVTIDDEACLTVLHHLVYDRGYRYEFGISGVCNILGAIATARHEKLGAEDIVVTVATDGLDRYLGYMKDLGPKPQRRPSAKTWMAELPGTRWVDTTAKKAKEKLFALRDGLWTRWYGRKVLDRLRDPAAWREEAAQADR